MGKTNTINDALITILSQASKNDRSRISRNLNLLKKDVRLLKENYTHRLYNMLVKYWRDKIHYDRSSYDDMTLPGFMINKCLADMRRIRGYKKIR
jgi:hypothetical protein